MSRSGKISEHSLPNSFNERCSRVAKKFFGGQGKSLHRRWHETAIAVVMSCRALPPKLPDTSDALTQMRLQKMQLSRSQLWGILGAPLQNWGDCGHSCRSCTLTEVNAHGTARHWGVLTNSTAFFCEDQQGLHGDFVEGRAWAPPCKGWTTKRCTWKRAEQRDSHDGEGLKSASSGRRRKILSRMSSQPLRAGEEFYWRRRVRIDEVPTQLGNEMANSKHGVVQEEEKGGILMTIFSGTRIL